ncbi:YafY family protein [Propionivibrio sp.]|uniref:helix-turn-helix transcriptional regulator n=1 Tax=Propionivibrio sp. TaxID=2212460 RepID=UPI0025DDFD4E|nr:WYL domain-containing protein [Propionivibrio sp.]
MDSLGISRATLNRDLAYLRNRFNAPIVFDHYAGGYRFDKNAKQVGTQYELPGLWFSAEEIHALLTMQHLLSNLDTGGLLGPHIKPLLSRLTALIGAADNPADEVVKRIRILTLGARQVHLDSFQAIGSALLRRKRLIVQYNARGTGETTEREISPQRLIHYRDNWYLDAWCHLRNELRSFSVDAIRRVELLDAKARDLSEKRLNDVLGSGYGIFAGKKVKWATLTFSPLRSRWVATEQWHPRQIGRLRKDGSYELKVPYSNDPELLMDILKYGADCEVEGPVELRERVATEVEKMANVLKQT